ncbi:hypothetical protein PoB_004859900 [Plakobranchus ocellatus]|uniref:Uncharacterized protein n=1 Tax=Plakobranchus ocellatus TaxID=259542 RepID=A0AAV4BUM2_9GAST|nr:hypothetical protein PoB_004859900 [Plakobranchus ocellatus]
MYANGTLWNAPRQHPQKQNRFSDYRAFGLTGLLTNGPSDNKAYPVEVALSVLDSSAARNRKCDSIPAIFIRRLYSEHCGLDS